MALCKPVLCLIGSSSFRQISDQRRGAQALFLKCLRSTLDKRNLSTTATKYGRFSPQKTGTTGLMKSSKITPTPFEQLNGEQNPLTAGVLWKPFLFTIAFSTTSLAGCAIWQYENVRKKAVSLLKRQANWASEKIYRFNKKHLSWRQKMNDMWNQLSEGEKLFAPICLANAIVFLAWRIPRFQPAMVKYFCSNPGSSVLCWPMVLSTFSHYSTFHLLANMYVLHSFSTSAVFSLGKEQFLGLYLAAGAISSFSSFVCKVIKNQPGLSIGASGAIMAILGYVCTQYPDTQLSVILIPWYTFSAGAAIKVIMGLDLTGVLLGWKFFDHAAHLGGALCGIGWCYWGNKYIWQNREPLLLWWHELRTLAEKKS